MATHPDTTAPPEPTAAPAQSVPTLHHLNSSQSLRILWALEELSPLPYNLKLYSRVKGRAPPELKKISPLGKSPVLTVEPPEPGKPTVTVLESRLILQYIADHYSNGVWTADQSPETRTRDQYWAEFATASLAPGITIAMIFGFIPMQAPALVRPLLNLFSKGAVPKVLAEVQEPFRLMDEALSETTGQPWFAGPKLGMADILMSFPMDMADQRGYLDAAKFPNLAAWVKRIHDRPAYKRALEKGGLYDLKMFGM